VKAYEWLLKEQEKYQDMENQIKRTTVNIQSIKGKLIAKKIDKNSKNV
jgi:hypothetical protein